MAVIMGLGLLFYILLGFRYRSMKETTRQGKICSPFFSLGLSLDLILLLQVPKGLTLSRGPKCRVALEKESCSTTMPEVLPPPLKTMSQ